MAPLRSITALLVVLACLLALSTSSVFRLKPSQGKHLLWQAQASLTDRYFRSRYAFRDGTTDMRGLNGFLTDVFANTHGGSAKVRYVMDKFSKDPRSVVPFYTLDMFDVYTISGLFNYTIDYTQLQESYNLPELAEVINENLQPLVGPVECDRRGRCTDGVREEWENVPKTRGQVTAEDFKSWVWNTAFGRTA